jgi:GNAT superfamily N-acetyltransferase
MNETTGTVTRLAVNEDTPSLKALWKTVFGDDDADIDHFFDTWFSPELTVVIDASAVMNGNTSAKGVENLAAAAYIVPVGDLVLPDTHDGKRLKCAMLYAIATLPEYRGHGYGEAVTRAAAKQASKLGYEAAVLKPADDSLFEFYAKRSEFREFFSACETQLLAAELPLYDPRCILAPVSPIEYRALRRQFLTGCTYIDMDERALSYQLYLCGDSGGGLYAIKNDGNNAGCAVIEVIGDTVSIKELLLDAVCRMADAVSTASQLIPAKNYSVRSVPETENPANDQCRRFGMMIPISRYMADLSVQPAKWYGLAFD